MAVLGIDSKQIRCWEKDAEAILQSLKGSRQFAMIAQPKWPGIEVQLHSQFKTSHKKGRSINYRWFEWDGKGNFKELYPEQIAFKEKNKVVFECCVAGLWFVRFKTR